MPRASPELRYMEELGELEIPHVPRLEMYNVVSIKNNSLCSITIF